MLARPDSMLLSSMPKSVTFQEHSHDCCWKGGVEVVPQHVQRDPGIHNRPAVGAPRRNDNPPLPLPRCPLLPGFLHAARTAVRWYMKALSHNSHHNHPSAHCPSRTSNPGFSILLAPCTDPANSATAPAASWHACSGSAGRPESHHRALAWRHHAGCRTRTGHGPCHASVPQSPF